MSATSKNVDQEFDIVIVSPHGRGNWLALELAQKGWKAALVDVTQQFDALTSGSTIAVEDVEGPFGHLEASDTLPSQRARLFDEGDAEVVPQGFSVWMKEGPIEFRSEISSFLLRSKDVAEEVESYLRRAAPKSRETERDRSRLSAWTFDRNWLAQFAHSFSSSRFLENHIAIESGQPSPLFSAFSIRRQASQTESKGLRVASTAGVRIVDGKISVEQIFFEGKGVSAIDLKLEDQKTLMKGKTFIWCFSHAETLSLFGERVGTKLYSNAIVHPTWSWERFRFDVSGGQEGYSSLPSWSCLIGDRDLAWTRANMIVLRPVYLPESKTIVALDAWMKCPAWMRHPKERNAFETVGREAKALIELRMPLLKLEVGGGDRATPLLWPVFELGANVKPTQFSNFFFDSADQWETLDWLGRFRHQVSLIPKLEKLKAAWEAEARREAAREEKRKLREDAKRNRDTQP